MYAGILGVQTELSALSWKDDMRNWPTVTLEMIDKFLLTTRAPDGNAEDARKSSQAFNYLSSGWVR